ncbi:MAG: SAM-dependent methyltransferase, partial [Acidimicrobiia bacterium]
MRVDRPPRRPGAWRAPPTWSATAVTSTGCRQAPPGQARHGSGNGQEAQRARLALDLAADGRDVAVVSSGDPGVFAMASAVVEELHRCAGDPRYAALDVAVVAGVTAATAAAARRGAILGHDFCVVSCSDLHKPLEVVERRVDAAARADFVVALYNPASSARPHQLEVILSAITRHRHPDTPVVVARD